MHPLLFLAIFINLATFFAFGIDKYRSIAKKRRISERSLLIMAIAGGSVGAISGQRIFRHKTQKFRGLLEAIAILQLMIVGWGIAYSING